MFNSQQRLLHRITQRRNFSFDAFISMLRKIVDEDILIFPDDDFSVLVKNRKVILTNTKTTVMPESRFKREYRKITRKLQNSDHRFVITKNDKREYVLIGIDEYEEINGNADSTKRESEARYFKK